MALSCNIDRRGRLARLLYGLGMLVGGLILLWQWAIPAATPAAMLVSWFVTICVTVAGLFAVFEARAGWCVMRAMGFRTPM